MTTLERAKRVRELTHEIETYDALLGALDQEVRIVGVSVDYSDQSADVGLRRRTASKVIPERATTLLRDMLQVARREALEEAERLMGGAGATQ